MRQLALVLVALVACSKKEAAKEAPSPPPTPDKTAPKTTPKPVDPPSAPGMVTNQNGPCEIRLALTPTKVSYDGGGLQGEIPWTPGTKPDVSALQRLAGKCGVTLLPTNDIVYQDVIAVMDTLVKEGLVDISLGDGKRPSTAPATAPTGTPPPSGIKMAWGSDGSLTGTLSQPSPSTDALKSAPVIIMTKTEVMFAGSTVGKIGDANLSAQIEKALPAKPADPLMILQADQGLTYENIAAAVKAASNAGYTNLLFAVKNK